VNYVVYEYTELIMFLLNTRVTFHDKEYLSFNILYDIYITLFLYVSYVYTCSGILLLYAVYHYLVTFPY